MGIEIISSCSLLANERFYSCPHAPLPAYKELMLGWPDFMTWWVWQSQAHDGQVWPHGYLIPLLTYSVFIRALWQTKSCLSNEMSVADGMVLLQKPKHRIVIPFGSCHQLYLMSFPNTETSNTTGSARLCCQVTGCLYHILDLRQSQATLKAGHLSCALVSRSE